MKKLAIVLFTLSACANNALQTGTPREVFIAAVAAGGCKVDGEAEARAVERATGLSKSELGKITRELWAEGKVKPAPNGGFILNTGPCLKT